MVGCCLLWTGAAAAQPDVDIVCPCRVSLGSDGLTLTLGLRNDRDEAATSIEIEAGVTLPDTAAQQRAYVILGRGTLDGVEVPANSTVRGTYAIDRHEIADDGQHSLQLRLFVDGEPLFGWVWTHPVDLSMSAWTTRELDYLADADGDGVGDLNEDIAGTDANDPASVPDTATIDALALYNRDFARLYRGDPLGRIHHVVTLANELFLQSDVDVRLRIVGFEQLEVKSDWNNFAAPDRAEVKLLEAGHGADIVLMFRPLGVSPVCGWADLPSYDRGHLLFVEQGGYARNLATVFGNCSGTTLAHEVGHVLGLGHSLRQGEIGTFKWARGHYVNPEDGLGIGGPGTLMTYGHTYTDRFANPAKDCGGVPCGVAREQRAGADAVAALAVTRFQAAALRAPKPDRDGDGFVDAVDQAPEDPAIWRDTDGDGVNNDHDTDDDGDGVADEMDAFPLDPTESADADGDGVGDNSDAFPDDPNASRDADGDGLGDSADREVPLFVAADDPQGRQGFVRIINRSPQAGTVRVAAIDDAGSRHGPATLAIDANAVLHFNSSHLEDGKADLGLPGFGDGTGSWRLVVPSALDIEVLAYVRAAGGFLTSMHDTAPRVGNIHSVRFFNPASNRNQRSLLRLVNPSQEAVDVSIAGIDDNGESPGDGVRLTVATSTSRWLSAADLETGNGLDGSLGSGRGKWRLQVAADGELRVMSLLESPTGHLSNLSTAPKNRLPWLERAEVLAMFPSSADRPWQGFVRIVNRDILWNLIVVHAYGDGGQRESNLYLPVDGVRHFNTDHLEAGNDVLGMPGVGISETSWWLDVSGGENMDITAYVRTADGFLTAMHDLAPTTFGRTPSGHRHEVVIFNPASNTDQRSLLRLVNPDYDKEVSVEIVSRDDRGTPGGTVRLALAPEGARTLTALELEEGSGAGFDGALGDGAGKWRLTLTADAPLAVMSLLRSPTGHLTNLSTGTAPRPLFAEPDGEDGA